MPIFEFRCEKCKKTFETLVFGNQAVCCPKCKSKKVKKLMSAFSHASEGKFTSSAGRAAEAAAPPAAAPPEGVDGTAEGFGRKQKYLWLEVPSKDDSLHRRDVPDEGIHSDRELINEQER